jgi:hypothetical protein
MLYIIEVNDPLANEKVMTPAIIMMVQNIFSPQVEMVMSPYPTVVMVYMVK